MQWDDSAKAEFSSLYAQVEKSNDDSKIVQCVDAMVAMLVRCGKAYTLAVIFGVACVAT